jgi:hypothetical protein
MDRMNYWQKCPLCNGTGKVSSAIGNGLPEPETTVYGAEYRVECPTCKGERILNILSGLPPSNSIQINQPVYISPIYRSPTAKSPYDPPWIITCSR